MKDAVDLYMILFALSAVGIICNFICCSYFMATKNRNGLSNNLIMILCCFDFIVCVTYPINWVFHQKTICIYSRYVSIADLVNKALMLTGFTMTGIITTTLTVLRSLLILRPLYLVRTKVVYDILLITSIATAVTAITLQIMNYLENSLLGDIVVLGTSGVEVTVCISSAIPAIYTLHKRKLLLTKYQLENVQIQRHLQNQHKASLTIIILTGIFVVSNVISWPTMLLVHSACQENKSMKILEYLKTSFLVNSVCNPLFIITRKQELRLFLMQKFKTIFACPIMVTGHSLS